MKYNLDYFIKLKSEGVKLKYTFFWSHKPERKNCFMSQHYPSVMEVDHVAYLTAEHYMMAQKAKLFGDKATRYKILAKRDPKLVQQLGREVKNFDEQIWQQHRTEIVIEGNYQKFKRCPELKQQLLATEDKIIAEASPTDLIWGIGYRMKEPAAKDVTQWPGQNLLGFCLMAIRDQLKNDVLLT